MFRNSTKIQNAKRAFEQKTGVKLNCITEDGEDYEVEVELDNEDGAVEDDETVDEGEIPAEGDFSDDGFDTADFDVAASRRSMNSNRRKPAGRPAKRARR